MIKMIKYHKKIKKGKKMIKNEQFGQTIVKRSEWEKIKSIEREMMLALKIQTFFHTELISLCVCAHAFIGLGWA